MLCGEASRSFWASLAWLVCFGSEESMLDDYDDDEGICAGGISPVSLNAILAYALHMCWLEEYDVRWHHGTIAIQSHRLNINS